jgi:hypothetical protein
MKRKEEQNDEEFEGDLAAPCNFLSLCMSAVDPLLTGDPLGQGGMLLEDLSGLEDGFNDNDNEDKMVSGDSPDAALCKKDGCGDIAILPPSSASLSSSFTVSKERSTSKCGESQNDPNDISLNAAKILDASSSNFLPMLPLHDGQLLAPAPSTPKEPATATSDFRFLRSHRTMHDMMDTGDDENDDDADALDIVSRWNLKAEDFKAGGDLYTSTDYVDHTFIRVGAVDNSMEFDNSLRFDNSLYLDDKLVVHDLCTPVLHTAVTPATSTNQVKVRAQSNNGTNVFETKKFKCTYHGCLYSSDRQDNMKRHVRTHEKQPVSKAGGGGSSKKEDGSKSNGGATSEDGASTTKKAGGRSGKRDRSGSALSSISSSLAVSGKGAASSQPPRGTPPKGSTSAAMGGHGSSAGTETLSLGNVSKDSGSPGTSDSQPDSVEKMQLTELPVAERKYSRWSEEQKSLFAEHYPIVGGDWTKLAEVIPDKTVQQISAYFNNNRKLFDRDRQILSTKGTKPTVTEIDGSESGSSSQRRISQRKKSDIVRLNVATSSKGDQPTCDDNGAQVESPEDGTVTMSLDPNNLVLDASNDERVGSAEKKAAVESTASKAPRVVRPTRKAVIKCATTINGEGGGTEEEKEGHGASTTSFSEENVFNKGRKRTRSLKGIEYEMRSTKMRVGGKEGCDSEPLAASSDSTQSAASDVVAEVAGDTKQRPAKRLKNAAAPATSLSTVSAATGETSSVAPTRVTPVVSSNTSAEPVTVLPRSKAKAKAKVTPPSPAPTPDRPLSKTVERKKLKFTKAELQDLLVDPESMLTSINLSSVLNLDAFLSLSPSERAGLYDLLPPMDRNVKGVMDTFSNNNMQFMASLHDFQTLLASGVYDPDHRTKLHSKLRRSGNWNAAAEAAFLEKHGLNVTLTAPPQEKVLEYSELDKAIQQSASALKAEKSKHRAEKATAAV